MGQYRLTAGLNSGDDALSAAAQVSLRRGQRYGPHEISTFDFTNHAINNAIPEIRVIKKKSNRNMPYFISYLGITIFRICVVLSVLAITVRFLFIRGVEL